MMNVASQFLLPRSAVASALYQTYERERRERLLRVMLPGAAVLFVLVCVVLTVRLWLTNPIPWGLWAVYVEVLLMTLCFLLGLVALRRGQTTLALRLMTYTFALGMPLIIALQIFFVPSAFGGSLGAYTLSELSFFACVIVLVGVLGTLWTIIGVTLLVNMVSLLLVYLAPRSAEIATVTKPEFDDIAIAALVVEWLIAAFLIANWWLTYRRTLHALSEAQERVQQAERLDALKNQFITHINHELRTPVMALQGYVEYLCEVQAQLSSEERASALERARRTGSQLSALLSSILDVQRVESDTEPFVPTAVPVLEALDAALSQLEPQGQASGGREVQVTLPGGVAIWGEPGRFQLILSNLLSNALKYSKPDTPIEVTGRVIGLSKAEAARRQGKSPRTPLVEVRVRDYGLGIPPEQAPLLFNRFTRLPRDLASAVQGSGSGLYLCKEMTERMGGTIRVESSGVEGEGSTFIVRLPLAPMQPEHPSQPMPADQAASS
jgi:signal transduction histidine kinase